MLRCMYPKIYRIPEDYISKSILKSELYENSSCKVHVLKVVSGSHLLYLSPYDSALVISLLTGNKDSKHTEGTTRDQFTSSNYQYKHHPLYKGVINRLINSVINYRFELYPYFFKSFSLIRERSGIRSLISVIVDRNIIKHYNFNTLVELFYISCHYASPKDSLYKRFHEIIIDTLVDVLKQKAPLNKLLTYKLLHSIGTIPTEDIPQSKNLISLILPAVYDEIRNGSLESKYFVRIFCLLYKLGILEDFELLNRRIVTIIDDLNVTELRSLLSISKELNDKSFVKLTELLKDKLEFYHKLGSELNKRYHLNSFS